MKCYIIMQETIYHENHLVEQTAAGFVFKTKEKAVKFLKTMEHNGKINSGNWKFYNKEERLAFYGITMNTFYTIVEGEFI